MLAEALAALRCDVEAPVVVALQPAEIDDSCEQDTPQDTGDVRTVFGGVPMVPDWLATGGNHHAKRVEEGSPPCRDRVPGLIGVRTRGLADLSDVALLEQGTHQLDTERASDMVVTDSGLPPGPDLLALPE
jgi:hypothetical protein